MTDLQVLFVDVYVLRRSSGGLEALCLRRAGNTRCPGSWETVHGHIAEGERPADAAQRELTEETGLLPERFYNLSRVESFYLHARDTMALIPVFAAFVAAGSRATLSAEHDDSEWLPLERAAERLAWPREGRALQDIGKLLREGDAGPLEDVLRVT